MEAKTYPEIRQSVLSGIFCAGYFSFGTACTEAARDNNTVNVSQTVGCIGVGNVGGFNPFYFCLAAKGDTGVLKGIDYGGIAVADGCVFAGDADSYFMISGTDLVSKITPPNPGFAFVPQIDSVFDFQQAEDFKIQAAVSEHSRYHIDTGRIGQTNDPF